MQPCDQLRRALKYCLARPVPQLGEIQAFDEFFACSRHHSRKPMSQRYLFTAYFA